MKDFFGYALVMAPTNRIKPYSLLEFQTNSEVSEAYSTIESIFKKDDSVLPIVNYDMPANVSNNIQFDLKIDADVKLFEKILKFVGSNVSAAFNYEDSDTINLKLTDPKSDAVFDMAKVDAFINTSTLFEDAYGFMKDLKGNKLFVVTEIIKCNNFTIENVSNKQTNTQAGADFKNIVDANANINSNKNINSSVIYNGEEYLTVGLKAWRIFYEKEWMNLFGKGNFRVRTSPDIKIVKGGENYPGEQLESTYVLL